MRFNARMMDQPTPLQTGNTAYDLAAVPLDTVWAEVAQSL